MNIKDKIIEIYLTWKLMPIVLRFISIVFLGFGLLGILIIFIPSTKFSLYERSLTYNEFWLNGYGPYSLFMSIVALVLFYGVIKKRPYSKYLIISFPFLICLYQFIIKHDVGYIDIKALYNELLCALLWLLFFLWYLFKARSCIIYYSGGSISG